MKVMKFFYKNGFGKRVMSMTLAFVMLFTMFAGQLPAGLLEVKAAETYDVTVHWNNSDNWDRVNVWAWTSAKNYTGGEWPGVAATANADNAGWYDYSMTDVDSSDLKLIFNNKVSSSDGGNTQTGDLSTDLTKGTEIWVSGGAASPQISYSAPENWVQKYSVLMHFDNASKWNGVNVWAWNASGDLFASDGWPGKAMTASTEKDGWYDFEITNLTVASLNFLLNTDNGNVKTANINYTLKPGNNEIWITGGASATSNTIVTEEPVEDDTTKEPEEEPEVLADQKNLKLHFNNNAWKWGAPALHFWGGNKTVVSGNEAGPTPITGWGADDKGYTLTNDGNGWYSIVINGDFTGFQFLDMNNPNNNTAGKGFVSAMEAYKGATPTDLYYKESDNTWYLDANYTTPLPSAEKYDVTLHVYNAGGWSTVALYAWSLVDTGSWPGTTIKSGAEAGQWYDYTIKDVEVGTMNFNVNNGNNGEETQSLALTVSKENTEFWIVAGHKDSINKGAVYTAEKDVVINEEKEEYKVLLHFYNKDNWEKVAAYVGEGDSWTELKGGFPGEFLKEREDRADWYDVEVTKYNNTYLNYIISDNGSESVRTQFKVEFAENETSKEVWYVGNQQYTTAPEEWKNVQVEVLKDQKNITIHFDNSKWNWAEPALHFWGGEKTVVSGYAAGPSPITGWGANDRGYTLTNDGNGMYSITINGDFEGFQFLDMKNPNNNTGGAGYTKPMEQCVGETPTDLYYKPDTNKWYVDAAYTTELTTKVDNSQANSIYYAKDVMEVKIGDKIYPMNVYLNGTFEATLDLEAGEYKGTLIANGTETDKTATLTLDKASKAYFRLDGENFKAETVAPAALVGNIDALSSKFANWNPASDATELTYLGGGLYMGTFTFDALTEDKAIEYKVAFNDAWDWSIGENGQNLKITVPKGTTSLTVLADAVNNVLYDDVRTKDFDVKGKAMNPYTTVISLIGDVRTNGDESWGMNVKGYEFTPVAENVFRYEKTFEKAGTYAYKAVFDYSEWYDKEGSGNRTIVTREDNTHVVFLYDAASGYLLDTVNNEADVAALLSMKVMSAKMEIIENKDGTVQFVAKAEDGQTVKLFYGDKKEVAEKGAEALTEVKMSGVSNGRSTSEELWLGDSALDLVYYYDVAGKRVLDGSNPTVTVGDLEYSNYTREAYKGRVVNVPGTFPGPSWASDSNKMTYAGNRTYTYTFKDVPAAKYEYKIAHDGSWAENYGANGVLGGDNIKITVPTKQDVTIYYSDVTHLAVNSIDYKFCTITLTGTGIPTGVKLTDEGLTGIYTAEVTLAAGTYDDVVIDCDGTKYSFASFTVDKEKVVTFCMDPVSGLYYHDASNEPINEKAIYFDSKDENYKSTFGAIATGEKVTFSITTGTDVTSASLLVKGNENKTVAMAKDGEATNGTQKWSAEVSLSVIGEYTYYFALSNGSSIAVYGDDDGYYGTGTVCDLTTVKPYDLVVYQSGYETPDWMKNAVIYQIFPDRFFDGDPTNNDDQTTARGTVNYEYISDWYTLPENPEQKNLLSEEEYKATGAHYGDGEWSNEIYGGDLEGITDRIDYLKALGVTVIYLNPVFSSISNHRYDACDYMEIDPVLGTEGDFLELVKIAEENGMKVVLDGVFNHVSDDSIYFDRYYKFIDDGLDTVGAYPYWAYVYDYMAENSASQADAEAAAKNYFTSTYGITDFSYVEWFAVENKTMKTGDGKDVCDTIGLRAGKPVYTYEGWWGYDSMPVIKSTNGSEYQTGNWAEEVIYNENNTSVTQYWISKGMDGWRLDVANEVSDETWQRFRESVKGLDSEAVIIGEIWDDATKYILGDMYDSVMNYMFRNAVTAFAMGTDAETTTLNMEKLRERYPEEAFYAMMNLVGSHDTTRVLSFLDGIGDDRADKSIEAAFPTYEKTSDKAKERQHLVAFLQFTYAGAPTIYYGDEIGMVGSDDPDDRRAFEWGKGNEELVTYYATLAEVRSQYSALRTGSVETFGTGSNNVVGFVRRDANDAVVVLANNSDKAVSVTIDLAKLDVTADALVNVLDETAYEVADNKATVSVPAYRGLVLVDNDAAAEIVVDTKALAPAYDEAYVIGERVVNPEPVTPSTPSTPDDDDDDDDYVADTEAPSTEAAGNGSTNAGTTKPSTGTKEETNNNETAEGPVEVIIPVDGSVAEKTEAIVEAIEEVKEGNDVVIKVIDAESGEAEVSIKVLNTLEENKGKDVELVIELANGFTWTINANSVDTDKLGADVDSINFWVEVVEEVVPENLISDVLPENADALEISLKHNGPFGLTAALDIPVGDEFAGRMATLYYFNPESNALEAQSIEEIGENGTVRFLFTHASDYVLVIEAAAEEVVDTELVDTEATEKDTEGTDNTTDSAEAGGSGMTIVIVLLVLALLIVGVVLLKKKKTA